MYSIHTAGKYCSGLTRPFLCSKLGLAMQDYHLLPAQVFRGVCGSLGTGLYTQNLLHSRYYICHINLLTMLYTCFCEASGLPKHCSFLWDITGSSIHEGGVHKMRFNAQTFFNWVRRFIFYIYMSKQVNMYPAL